MFRLLVADDEKVTRNGIISIIRRGIEEEIEFVQAENGQQALEIIEYERVHVVIADICMPICNGLEFIERVRQIDQSIPVLIISGYREFDYARQAILLGVKAYIMKPIQGQELLAQIEECLEFVRVKQKERLDRVNVRKQYIQAMEDAKTRILKQLLDGGEEGELEKALGQQDIVLKLPFKCAAAIEYELNRNSDEYTDFAVKNMIDEYMEKKAGEKLYTVVYRGGCLGLLFEARSQTELKEKILYLSSIMQHIAEYGRIRIAVGIGRPVNRLKDYHESFREALQCVNLKMFYGDRQIFCYENEEGYQKPSPIPHNPESIWESIHEILQGKRNLSALKKLEKIYSYLSEGYYQNTEEKRFVKKFSQIWSVGEFRAEIRRMLEKKGEAIGNDSVIASNVMDYIMRHLTEDIDLNILASEFSKTPGYVSMLFRKQYKIGIGEFMTKKRMELAKQMLEDRKLAIAEIGKQCGYQNTKYFSVLFRKNVGMTPKQYREEIDGKQRKKRN